MPHQDLPLCFGPDAPAVREALPQPDRSRHGRLTEDLCTIDGQHIFIRGRLEIPICDGDQSFVWLAWSSLSQAGFLRTQELWSTPGRERERPYFGWLSSSLPCYQDTLNLKLRVHTRPVGERPGFELEPTDHPLAIEQREGIGWERVHEIVHRVMGDGRRRSTRWRYHAIRRLDGSLEGAWRDCSS
jgi:hypothetical protein